MPRPPRAVRAPYALPPGTRALQDPPWARRALVAAAATLACIGGTAGYLAGRSRAASDAPVALPATTVAHRSDLDLATARALAKGPLQELLRHYRSYLRVVARADDEQLWAGVDRMLRSVLADVDHEDEELVAALHGALKQVAPPPAIDRLVPLLELRLRESDRQARRQSGR